MNSIQHSRTNHRNYQHAAEDRQTLTLLMTAVYSPLALIVAAAAFIA